MAKLINCIPKDAAEKLKGIIQTDKNIIKKLDTMPTEERIAFFQKTLDKENAIKLNKGYEMRLSSKKKEVRLNYLDRTLSQRGFSPEKKSLIEKIKKSGDVLNPLDTQQFAESIAESRLGVHVTREEAKNLFSMGQKAVALKKKVDLQRKGITIDQRFELETTEEAIAAARAEHVAEKYIEDLSRIKANLFDDIKKAKGGVEKSRALARTVVPALSEGAGVAKSATASFDNSFFGRQGLKKLMHAVATTAYNPKDGSALIKEWLVDFGKSFSDIGKTLKSAKISESAKEIGLLRREELVLDELKIMTKASPYYDIFRAAKNNYGIGVVEEAFPVATMEKVHGFVIGEAVGRGYKATEVAYNAAAIRTRVGLGQYLIKQFHKQGLDVLDPKVADAIGEVVSSMTGRGEISFAAKQFLGKFYFSIGLFTSILDTVFMPAKFLAKGLSNADPVLRQTYRKASFESFKPLAAWSVLLGSASLLGITSLDPRDRRFGKLTFGDKEIDVSGGNLTFWGTVAKIFSGKVYDERKGGWIVDSNLVGDKFERVIETVFSNRLAPMQGLVRDMINGEHFGGEPVTEITILENLFIPITLRNAFAEYWDKKDLSSAFAVLLGEGLGFNTRDMRIQPKGKEWEALKEADATKYWEAVADMNEDLLPIAQKYRQDEEFQNLPIEEASKILLKEYRKLLKKVISDYKVE